MNLIPDINNNLPLDKAELIAFFLESFLYGVSALLFIITLWVLVYYRKTERLNKRLVVMSCTMMFLGTLHMTIDLTRILQGFIHDRDQPGGPIAYFAKLFLWSHVFKTAIFAVQTVLADSFATYRCWIVWGRSWAVIIPALFVIGTLITSVGIVHGCAVLKDGDSVFASSLTGWITSFFSLTLATNIVCTSLIAIRIWYTTRKVSRFSCQRSLMPVVVVVVESGAIYSISCITLLTVYVLGSNAQYPALDGTFPIISIVFNLIIVRIALGIAHCGASNSGGMYTTQNIPALDSTHPCNDRTQYPLKPLEATITWLAHGETYREETSVKDRDSFISDGAAKEGACNAA